MTNVLMNPIQSRLIELLETCTEGSFELDHSDTGPNSIRRIGVSSVAMLEFLVAIEDEFGIEWDDDVDQSVFDSFDGIAGHIEDELA